MEYFSKDRNRNNSTVTILTIDIPIPDFIMVNRSFTFTRKIIAAICEKKKYIPASMFKEPGISPLKIIVPNIAYKDANTIANRSLINNLTNNTPVATGTV